MDSLTSVAIILAQKREQNEGSHSLQMLERFISMSYGPKAEFTITIPQVIKSFLCGFYFCSRLCPKSVKVYLKMNTSRMIALNALKH